MVLPVTAAAAAGSCEAGRAALGLACTHLGSRVGTIVVASDSRSTVVPAFPLLEIALYQSQNRDGTAIDCKPCRLVEQP